MRKSFEVGDRVKIIRARHGWYDGWLEGTIERRFPRPAGSTFTYMVRDDTGQIHDVEHCRDLRSA